MNPSQPALRRIRYREANPVLLNPPTDTFIYLFIYLFIAYYKSVEPDSHFNGGALSFWNDPN